MKFLILMEVRNNFPPSQAVEAQKAIGAQMQKIMQSGKVKEMGIFADRRGGYFLGDFNTAEELFSFLAPLEDTAEFTSHPIIGPDTLGKFFEEYAKTHR